jgi:hypothetical protein
VSTGNRIGYVYENLNPDEWAGRQRVPPPKPDSKIEKWRRWAERIRTEVIEEVFTNRAAHRAWLEVVVEANDRIPGSDILDYWVGNYHRSQAVAVRRQIDLDDRSISLGRLLRELEQDRGLLTREWYVGQFHWGQQGLGSDGFDVWAYLDPDRPGRTESGHELSALRIRHDIERLDTAAANIKHHVNKVIAHSNRTRPTTSPTVANLDAAIDVLGEVFTSYYCLLMLRGLVRLDAVPQYDRLAPFRLAWIED